MSPDYETNLFLRDEYMNYIYYWADQVKDANNKLDLTKYNVADAFDAMLYSADRWSWMENAVSYLDSSSGVSRGTWGFSLTQHLEYNDGRVFIEFILQDSPFAKHGVTRGAMIKAIADHDFSKGILTQDDLDYINDHIYDSPQTFTFVLTNGEEVTVTETMPDYVRTNYILASKIFDGKDFEGLTEPVGYFNLLQFVSSFVDDLDVEFDKFKKAGVKKMIVDLRYNGGGDSNVSQRLASFLAPAGKQGLPYVVRTFNTENTARNTSEYFGRYDDKSKTYSDMSIGLEEVFFIMDNGSASASEMVYNGLRPYYKDKLHLVGQQTYGKPNGMMVLLYPGTVAAYEKYIYGDFSDLKWAFYPICFFNNNSEGDGIPYGAKSPSGFVPDNVRPDDCYHDFCAQEDRIKACLNYIVRGEYPALPVGPGTKAASSTFFESFVPEWQSNPHYGKDAVMPDFR